MKPETLGDILVVDDNISNLHTIEAILKGQGYKVRCIPDPETALEVVTVKPPEVLLLDVLMPGLNGYEMCRRIKANPLTRDFPIIFLTALKEVEDLVEGFEAGGVAFLSKPIHAEQLLVHIKTHLELFRARKTIQDHQVLLEQQVAERTSQLQKANKELKRNEERYRLLFNNMNEGFAHAEIIVDSDGVPIDWQYIEVNPAFERQTGLKADDVIGRRITEILPGVEKDKANWIDRYGEVALIGEERYIEDYSGPIGRWYAVHVFCPRIGEFAATFVDITDRKAREALLDARLRFSEKSFTSSVDELIQFFLDEVEKLTESEIGFFNFINEDQQTIELQTWSTNTLEKMCTAEGKGMHYPVSQAGVWVDCVHKRRPVIHNDYLSLPHKKCLPAGHAPIVRELVVPVIRGNKIRVILGVGNKKAFYTEQDVETVSALADLALEIIERKKAEMEIQKLNESLESKVLDRTEKLRSLNKELESFAYSVSHDLRSPLRAISGFSEIINRKYKELMPDEGRHYLENILDAGDQMDRLINDLLQYSRLGRKAVNISEISINSVLESVVKKFEAQVAECGGSIKIESDIPDVLGNKTLLDQIFTNLIDNALKYRKNDVPLEITISWKEVRGKKIVITVKDNGIGIPEKMQEKVFNIFQRLHSDEDIPGSGVGLAIVKKAVDLQNAAIRMKSIVNQGTDFSIELTVSEGAELES